MRINFNLKDVTIKGRQEDLAIGDLGISVEVNTDELRQILPEPDEALEATKDLIKNLIDFERENRRERREERFRDKQFEQNYIEAEKYIKELEKEIQEAKKETTRNGREFPRE